MTENLHFAFLYVLSIVILGYTRGIPIFSSPEPLGSQGELIGWP